MKIPAIQGTIKRRILLNYAVDPIVVRKLLPGCFSPKLVSGVAIAGICLIRLEAIRPKAFPFNFGISSENSAHRIAVEWNDESGALQEGVFIPRRDTNSKLNSWAGGRLFPGVHRLACFKVRDNCGNIAMRIHGADSEAPLVDLEAHETDLFPKSSVFSSLTGSSKFFEGGCIGYSSRPNSCTLDGMLLQVGKWKVAPLAVDRLHSKYFDDRTLFPAGSISFDHALIMRDIRHEWHSQLAMRG